MKNAWGMGKGEWRQGVGGGKRRSAPAVYPRGPAYPPSFRSGMFVALRRVLSRNVCDLRQFRGMEPGQAALSPGFWDGGGRRVPA